MNTIVIVLSIFLGLLIVTTEIRRLHSVRKVDFLLGASLLYFVLFVVVPLYVQLADHNRIIVREETWGYLLQVYDVQSLNYVYASILAIVGYVFMRGGYVLADKLTRRSDISLVTVARNRDVLSEKILCTIAIVFAVIGIPSFAIYVLEYEGLTFLLTHSFQLRSGSDPIESRWGFLLQIARFTMVSSFCFFALSSRWSSMRSTFTISMFVVTLVFSILICLVLAGRLHLASYIGTLVLFGMIHTGKIRPVVVLLAGIGSIILVYFGPTFFNYLFNPLGMERRLAFASEDSLYIFERILVEFIFPYITLANAIEMFSDLDDFIYFRDILYMLPRLIPSRLVPLELPETSSDINTAFFKTAGEMPVDLLTFGYFSMGVAGLTIVAFAYGCGLKMLDRMFPSGRGVSISIFRTAWLVFIVFRVMYGEPAHALRTGLALVLATFAFWLYMEFRSRNSPTARRYVFRVGKVVT